LRKASDEIAAKTAQSLGPEREKTAGFVQEAAAARQELTASTRCKFVKRSTRRARAVPQWFGFFDR
jgi:hypothetical protein